MKVAEKIEKKISRIKDGMPFTYQELNINANEYSAATKAVERLLKKGIINRASTGLFYKPRKTAFGEIKPKEEELLTPYLFEGNTRVAYITGTALYNKMGLTTQVPKNIKVASRGNRIDTRVGNIEIKSIKSYVEVTNSNYYLLELLDVLKDFRKIPDIDQKMTITYLFKRIKDLTEADKDKLIKIALKYPPRVRAFLGALLSKLKIKRTEQLKKSINPLTTYKYRIPPDHLSTIAYWNIR